MTAPWRKVVQDVWRERNRTALVVLAIAIGLAGFLAVLSTFAVLRRELNRGYLATNPASAVLRTDAVDGALLADVIARDDVEDADARRVLNGRIRTGLAQWQHLVLFVIRDFRALRIAVVTPEEGEWPPGTGELWIERDAFQVAKARIGDVVTVETPAGGEHTLRVAGRVYDPGQAQARMENMVYGYITPETLALLGETPVLDRLYLIASGDRFDEARVQLVAADVKAWLESLGHAVSRMDVPPPGRHPHEEIMGVLLLVMAAFGLLALVLSGVIAANLLFALMAAERRQIGVMKAVGGTRGQIAGIYLAQAAVLGVAAIALAAPLGIAGGRELSRRFAVLLNFDLATLAVPIWVYLRVGFVGLIVPLAAAAYPVWSATAVTVRAALSDSGVDPAAFGSARLDRLLAGVGGAGRPFLLGVRNSVRRRTRTALTLFTLTAAGAFFVSAASLRTSMMAAVDRRFGAGTYGAEERYAFDQHMLMIYVFLVVVAAVLAAIGGLGMMTATSLNVLERRRELGVLRAIGAVPAMVGAIVVTEAVFVTVLAWAMGVLVAWPITAGVASLLTSVVFPGGLDASLSRAAIAIWLGVSVSLAIVSSLAPAVRASQRSVREAVSHE